MTHRKHYGALVIGGIILFVAGGCSNKTETVQTSDYETVSVLGKHSSVHKFYDKSEGIVCYVFTHGVSGSINCMVARGQGDNQ